MHELSSIRPGGVFLRREALQLGYDDHFLKTALRAQAIVRVRQGAYVDAHPWQGSDAAAQHRLYTIAVLAVHQRDVAVSHTSAALVHQLAVWEPDLRYIHLTVLSGRTTRSCSDVRYHRGSISREDVEEAPDGGLVVNPARAALEHASLVSTESGLVTLDSLVMRDPGMIPALSQVFESRARWPGNAHLHIPMRLARYGAESVGETRLRYLCWEYHLPEPELQVPVYDDDGQIVGVADFAWRDRRLLGEFDGKAKYSKFLRPGEEPADAVFREKKREDRMREYSGCSMIRFTWRDLYRRDHTAARISRALGLT